MYLARLQLNQSRQAILWSSNPYRVHQRLRLAYPREPRLLFRIETTPAGKTHVLVQSQTPPDWRAFADFPVLQQPPDYKSVDLQLALGGRYRFRLLANPTAKRRDEAGRPVRLSLFKTEEQEAWLRRKLAGAGAELIAATSAPQGLQRSRKSTSKDVGLQTHFAVLFEGVLLARVPETLTTAVHNGLGPAKGYGFGLLSLARA